MHNEMNDDVRQQVVTEISLLIESGSLYDYKDFMNHLKAQDKRFLRGHMMLNKFLYGSLVKEAKSSLS